MLVYAVTSVVALLAATGVALAQRPMGIVDLINIPRIGDPQLSPDGRAGL